VSGLTSGTLQITGGTPAANKVLTSDASGNATWQTPTTGADNLGNHTATQALNMGTNNILASGANSTYGALTIQGEKNTWSGVNFKNSGGANSGTLMMTPSYSGFYNSTDSGWRMYVTDGGTVVANDFTTGARSLSQAGTIDTAACVNVSYSDGGACGAQASVDCTAYGNYVLVGNTTGLRYPGQCSAAVAKCCRLR
jgi:hypothetical protein